MRVAEKINRPEAERLIPSRRGLTLAALASCVARLLTIVREIPRIVFFALTLPPFTRDLALFFGVHRRETAVLFFVAFCHDVFITTTRCRSTTPALCHSNHPLCTAHESGPL